MTKKELVAEIAIEVNKSKKEVEEFLNAYIEVVGRKLAEGESIQLVGFGTFEIRERAARAGRNIHTGEPIEIKATNSVHFKAGKILKDIVNQ